MTLPKLMVLSTFFPREMPKPSFTSQNTSAPGEISLLTDGHVHTKYCHHAKGEMEHYVLSAISIGLEEIVFLEHMEAGVECCKTTWLTESDFDRYFSEGQQLQEKYAGKIQVSLGVETGYSPTHKEELLERLAKRNWDRIGVSYHFMPSTTASGHINLLSKKKRSIKAIEAIGTRQVLTNYLSTLTEAVKFLPGTVLCHLDAALRFQPKVRIDQEYLGQIRLLLSEVKKKGMALEINTSGFTIRGLPFPARFIIMEALELGIPLVPGSDAHAPDEVGRGFELLLSYLGTV